MPSINSWAPGGKFGKVQHSRSRAIVQRGLALSGCEYHGRLSVCSYLCMLYIYIFIFILYIYNIIKCIVHLALREIEYSSSFILEITTSHCGLDICMQNALSLTLCRVDL